MNTPTKTVACSSSRAVAFAIQDLTSCLAFGGDRLSREGTITGPVQWVSTSTKGFASVSGSGPGAADVPIYAIEMRGRFVLDNAPRPAGAKSPEGSIMIVLVPVSDGDQAGGGVLLRPTVTDLSSFGHAHWYRGNG